MLAGPTFGVALGSQRQVPLFHRQSRRFDPEVRVQAFEVGNN